MSAITVAQIQIHNGITMVGTTTITIARKNAISATLSSLAPRSLCCFMVLATSPSAKSLAPQYTYNTQKSNEKGVENSRTTAHTRRVAVIMFAKFLI